MNKKTKIFSDFSKIAVDAFGTLSGIKKEIDTIVKMKLEKFINKADLVKRDEFEVLKLMVNKLSKKNSNLEKSIKSLKSKKFVKKPRKTNKISKKKK